MARPQKKGLDYFELDCNINHNEKLIQAEYGLKGFAIVVKLYQKIFGELGYYCEWDKDSLLLFMSENGVSSGDKNLINEVVAACIRRGIFSENLFKRFGILTSEWIQETYLNATSRREKVEMKKEYLLICVSQNNKNVVINPINVDKNNENANNNTQSSKEKSREEDITVSKDTVRQTDVRRILEKWNSLKKNGIKQVSKLGRDSKRYQSLVARINQYGVEDVLAAIDKISSSDFLQGKNKSGWVITFDWFVRPNNFPKVLEGNYDNNGRKPQNASSKNSFHAFPQREYNLDDLEKELLGGKK